METVCVHIGVRCVRCEDVRREECVRLRVILGE